MTGQFVVYGVLVSHGAFLGLRRDAGAGCYLADAGAVHSEPLRE